MKEYYNKSTGYKQIFYSNKVNGVHRYIMEQHLGRKLSKDEIVHHINEDKTDDRIENLLVMSRAEHSRHHNYKGLSNRIITCSNCNNEFVKALNKITYAVKHNQKMFCSRKCIGLYGFTKK